MLRMLLILVAVFGLSIAGCEKKEPAAPPAETPAVEEAAETAAPAAEEAATEAVE